MNDYTITRIKNDVNGNPRRVIHFLAFITDADRAERASQKLISIGSLYDLALWKARKLGGKKFHNRQYGGGIVFQAYSDDEVHALVARALAKADKIANG
jgi:hypothetical protein